MPAAGKVQPYNDVFALDRPAFLNQQRLTEMLKPTHDSTILVSQSKDNLYHNLMSSNNQPRTVQTAYGAMRKSFNVPGQQSNQSFRGLFEQISLPLGQEAL